MTPIPNPRPGFNPWPYGIAGFLVLFFSCVVAAGFFASRQRIDLVRSDYYEEELRFQKQLDRVKRTQGLPRELSIQLAAASRTIALGLPAEHASQSPSGTVQLYRPSDARMDRQFPLTVDAAGHQSVDAASLEPGLWKLRVTWQAGGTEYFHDTSIVIPATFAKAPAAKNL